MAPINTKEKATKEKLIVRWGSYLLATGLCLGGAYTTRIMQEREERQAKNIVAEMTRLQEKNAELLSKKLELDMEAVRLTAMMFGVERTPENKSLLDKEMEVLGRTVRKAERELGSIRTAREFEMYSILLERVDESVSFMRTVRSAVDEMEWLIQKIRDGKPEEGQPKRKKKIMDVEIRGTKRS